jgi:hypothetical protein
MTFWKLSVKCGGGPAGQLSIQVSHVSQWRSHFVESELRSVNNAERGGPEGGDWGFGDTRRGHSGTEHTEVLIIINRDSSKAGVLIEIMNNLT